MKILFVDDEPSIRELFSLTFGNTYQIFIAKDGQEALELIENNSVDLIITDVSLPKMSGVDFIRTIRSKGNYTPFIIITGDSNIELAINTFRMGAIDFFLKPFRMSNLKSVIERFESMHIIKDELVQSKDIILNEENTEYELEPKIRRVNYYVNMLMQKFSFFPNITEEDKLALKVCLFELISNAIEHGTAGINYEEKKMILEKNENYYSIIEERCKNQTKKVFVKVKYLPHQIKITIQDEGNGFDPNNIPNPIQSPNNLYSGRGLFLTKLNIDKLEFNDIGNEVTIIRNLKSNN